MKRKLNKWKLHQLTVLLFLFITNLRSQTKVVSDSLQCFSPIETRKIAKIILQSKECEQLLDITNKQLRIKMEIIADSDTQIKILKNVSKNQESIIANKQTQLDETSKALKREVRRKKFWKWVSTSTAVAGVIIVVIAVH